MTAHFSCRESVWHSGMFSSSTCSRRARFDAVDGIPTKCKQHSDGAKAERKAKQDEKFRRDMDACNARADAKKRAAQAVEDLATLRAFFEGKCQLDWPDDVLTILSAKGGDDE